MRILALVPGGISDQFLFFPTLADIHRYYPKAQVDVITDPVAVGAYRVSTLVNKAVPFDFSDKNSLADWGNLVGVMREREYDAVLSADNGWGLGLLLWLTGIPNRIGFSGPANLFLTQALEPKADQYKAQKYHHLLQGIDIEGPCPEVSVSVPRKDIDWAEAEQKRLGMASGYLLIDGRTESLEKANYPLKSWRLVLKEIRDRQPDLPILVVQDEESPFADALKENGLDLKVSMPTDLGKLAALIAGSNIVITTHSVAMQLAVAVQTFAIGLLDGADADKMLPNSDKFVGLSATTRKVEDIAPQQVLETLIGG